MAVFFMDTSALAKRYVSQETGHAFICALCEPTANNIIVISQATLVEAISALCRKAREPNLAQRITLEEREELIANFHWDTIKQYDIVEVDLTRYYEAGELCRHHPLRAYDAVQLACALYMNKDLIDISQPPLTFLSADNKLLEAARAEGLQIGNPNNYP